ncbi:MAG: biotin--[acetyl-CoA-carboxylase] ligase [Alphaproteobacteria bacterium]|nr:biotin--[acetyl-CoA-carboxylase] ligase [Alphaproteobacteria bacterium]
MADAPLHDLDTVDSTNTLAKRLAGNGTPDGTVVSARIQTAGRGRHARRWDSPAGNLHWSMVVRPRDDDPPVWSLSMVAALALHELVSRHATAPESVKIKWPNDVLVDGAKIAGILLESGDGPESGVGWVVVGIGLNITTPPAGDLPYPTTHLNAIARQPTDRDTVLPELTTAFRTARAAWRRDGLRGTREAMATLLAGLGGSVTIRVSDRPDGTIRGTFVGLDPNGHALVDTADGTRRRISAGDVLLGAPNAASTFPVG